MQSPVEPPRSALTLDQVVWLIEDAPLVVGYGAELLDMGLNVLADLSSTDTGGTFAGGNVSRKAYANLHGEGEFAVTQPLDWGTAIIRPYQTLRSGSVTARFNLGAYFTNTPDLGAETSPQVIEVRGYDILSILDDSIGESYSVPAGTSPLAWVEQILIDRGVQAYFIDQAKAANTLSSALTWAIDDDPTWLVVVNTLLGSVGYMGIWSDWNGRLMAIPYIRPEDRGVEWVYRATGNDSLILPDRKLSEDWYLAPNRWVAVRSSGADEAPPVEGNGVYTKVNQTNGRTSVEARGGRVITAPLIRVEATDQSALVAAVDKQSTEDMRLHRTVVASTSPNPLHWHFDRLAVYDPALGSAFFDCLSTSWRLPLDGEAMAHEWTVLS